MYVGGTKVASQKKENFPWNFSLPLAFFIIVILRNPIKWKICDRAAAGEEEKVFPGEEISEMDPHTKRKGKCSRLPKTNSFLARK